MGLEVPQQHCYFILLDKTSDRASLDLMEGELNSSLIIEEGEELVVGIFRYHLPYTESHLERAGRSDCTSRLSKLQPRVSYRIHTMELYSVIKGKNVYYKMCVLQTNHAK